jgi:hypothetical protein
MFALPMLIFTLGFDGFGYGEAKGTQPEAGNIYGRLPESEPCEPADCVIEARKAGALAVISQTALRFALQLLRLCTR